MTYEEAKKIIGDVPVWCLRYQLKALETCPWLSADILSPSEERRLMAARIVVEGETDD